MATNPIAELTAAPAWLVRARQHGYYLKPAIITTLIMGIYLHVTSLFIGRELLLRYILTPSFDAVLAVPNDRWRRRRLAGLEAGDPFECMASFLLWLHHPLFHDQYSHPRPNLHHSAHRLYPGVSVVVQLFHPCRAGGDAGFYCTIEV